jgi:hypothetical protein
MDDAVCHHNDESNTDNTGLSRRQVLAGAGGTGLLAAVAPAVLRAPAAQAAVRAARQAAPGGGTPEQVHLTWGSDPATSVVVSWATPGQAVAPRVLLDGAGPGAGRRVTRWTWCCAGTTMTTSGPSRSAVTTAWPAGT